MSRSSRTPAFSPQLWTTHFTATSAVSSSSLSSRCLQSHPRFLVHSRPFPYYHPSPLRRIEPLTTIPVPDTDVDYNEGDPTHLPPRQRPLPVLSSLFVPSVVPPVILPIVTLLSVSLLSSSGRVPSSVRNAPVAFLLSALLCNLNLLHGGHTTAAIDMILSYAPHAVVLLLLSSSSTSTSTSTTKSFYVLLTPFLIGAAATFISALIPPLLPALANSMQHTQLAALLAAYTATYVGGSLNFVAVARALDLSPQLSAAAVAVDMSAMAVYFAMLFGLAARVDGEDKSRSVTDHDRVMKNEMNSRAITTKDRYYDDNLPIDNSFNQNIMMTHDNNKSFTIPIISLLRSVLRFILPLVISFTLISSSNSLVNVLRLPNVCSLILSSFTALTLSNSLSTSKFINKVLPLPLSSAPLCATLALNLFFAALGASARLSAVLSASPAVLACALVILLGHAIILYVVGHKILHIHPRNLLIASNCNIGGATTAPAYAAACGWQKYVPAAVAAGTLGYVIATPLALLVFKIVVGLVATK